MNVPFRLMMRRDVACKDWDALADSSDEAWLWHRYDFQDALETWPGSTDESFALFEADGGQALALVPLRRITRRVAGLLPVHILESFGGVAIRNGLGEKGRRAVLMAARDQLVARVRAGICLEARIFLPAMAPALRGPDSPRVNPLLEMGCDNTLTQTWVVDLSGGQDSVWNRMERRARKCVRKAEKAGVIVREAHQGDLDIYYRLHEETYSRTGARPHPKDYFRIIWDKFLSVGLARVWVAELDGETVALKNSAIYKHAAVSWTAVSNAKGLDAEANTLLQWRSMQWMIDNGIQWYETGEAFPNHSSGKSRSISDFKKSFGGSLYPYYKGRLRTGRIFETLYQMKKLA